MATSESKVKLIDHLGGKKVIVFALVIGLVGSLALSWGPEGAELIGVVLLPVTTLAASYFGVNAALTNGNGK